MSETGGFTPTDRVPPTGMQAWLEPDPAQQPIETLQGLLPVQVTSREGGWAQIVCSNGWTGWVEGRLLVPFVTPAPAAEVPASVRIERPEYSRDRRPRGIVRRTPELLPFLGAILALVGAYLPWYKSAHSVNAFRISALYSLGLSDKLTGASAGLVILIACIAGMILSWLEIPAGVRHASGLVVAGVSVGFGIRTAIAVHEHFASVLRLGIVASIAGGMLLLASPHRKRRLTD